MIHADKIAFSLGYSLLGIHHCNWIFI